MKRQFIIPVTGALLLLLYSFMPLAPGNAVEIVRNLGFTQISLQDGATLWRCGRGNITAVAFSATNAQGRRFTGVVCCGIFKDCVTLYR